MIIVYIHEHRQPSLSCNLFNLGVTYVINERYAWLEEEEWSGLNAAGRQSDGWLSRSLKERSRERERERTHG